MSRFLPILAYPSCTHCSNIADCACSAMWTALKTVRSKDILFGELAFCKRPKGCPQLQYKDVCKGDMKALDINTEIWEDTTANHISWHCLLKKQLRTGEERILNLAEQRRARQKARAHGHPPPPPTSNYICSFNMQRGLPPPHWSYQPPTMLF